MKSNGRSRLYLILPILSLMWLSADMQADAIDWTTEVDRLFQQWDHSDTPGLMLAVVKDGEIVYERGYGMANLRYGVPITSSTVFRLGSFVKQITAFSIMLLEEEGALSLEDDIRIYLPNTPDFGETITIRHLLYHTSGLRDHISLMRIAGWNLFDDIVNRDQTFNIINRQRKLNHSPGDQCIYSNANYLLLAEIVTKVSDMTFPEFVRQRIFDPLEMIHSGFIDNNRIIVENLADAYMPLYEGGYEYTPINYASVGEGGMYSTVVDLAKWNRNFYVPIVGSRSIFAKMQQKYRLNDGAFTPYSMGMIIDYYNNQRLIFWGGALPGFVSSVVRFPQQQISVIALSNMFDMIEVELATKSIQIVDIFNQRPRRSIRNSFIHEFSQKERWMGEGQLFALDSELFPFSKDSKKLLQKKITDTTMRLGLSQFIPESAAEYLGRYYSEELDIFYTLSLNDEGYLIFQPPRMHPYLFRLSEVRNDQTFQDYDLASWTNQPLYTGRFLRNAKNQVVGFLLSTSSSRVVDLEFRKGDVVTLN